MLATPRTIGVRLNTEELEALRVVASREDRDPRRQAARLLREGHHDDLVLALSMACWYRDCISHHYDDAIADGQQRAAAARAERAGFVASR